MNRRDERHARQRRMLAEAVGLLAIGPLSLFIGVTIIAALFGIDLWGIYGP